VQPRVEYESQVETANRANDRQIRANLLPDREIPLAAELERLELDLDVLTMLFPGAQSQPAEREAGHGAP